MQIYLAGPLFAEAERPFNAAVAERLEAAGYKIFLPQRDAPRVSGKGSAERVFEADVDALKDATAVVAICEGTRVDDGTAWEIGYAFARGIPVVGLRDRYSHSRPGGKGECDG